jgi:hypothetical protein
VEERILTKHSQGKSGVNISKRHYDVVREAILVAIRAQGEITFQDLLETVERQLQGRFDGSISWYTTHVKLDLEARGVIERIPQSSPQRLRLAQK